VTHTSPDLSTIVSTLGSSIFQLRGAYGIETATAFSDTLIVSTAHSIDANEPVVLTTLDGTPIETELLGIDPRLDIAVFRATQGGLSPIQYAEPKAVGEPVFTLGANRDGQGPRISLGVISALGSSWLTRGGARVDAMIDVDAELPWGSSGGPLLDLSGSQLGLNTHALRRGGSTLPNSTLKVAVEQIAKNGSVTPGWLGVRVHQVDLPAEIATAEGQRTGMLVVWRGWRSAARSGDIQVGDILLGVNGQPLTDYATFRAAISGAGGGEVSVRRIRAGEVADQTLTIQGRKARRRTRRSCGSKSRGQRSPARC